MGKAQFTIQKEYQGERKKNKVGRAQTNKIREGEEGLKGVTRTLAARNTHACKERQT